MEEKFVPLYHETGQVCLDPSLWLRPKYHEYACVRRNLGPTLTMVFHAHRSIVFIAHKVDTPVASLHGKDPGGFPSLQ